MNADYIKISAYLHCLRVSIKTDIFNKSLNIKLLPEKLIIQTPCLIYSRMKGKTGLLHYLILFSCFEKFFSDTILNI